VQLALKPSFFSQKLLARLDRIVVHVGYFLPDRGQDVLDVVIVDQVLSDGIQHGLVDLRD